MGMGPEHKPAGHEELPSDLGSLLSELKAALQSADSPSSVSLSESPIKTVHAAVVASAVLEICDMKSRTADIALNVQRTLGLMGGKKSGDGIYVKPAELLQGLPSGNVSVIAAQFKALIGSGVLEEGFITVRGGYGSTRQESLGVRVREDMRDTVRAAARRMLPPS